MKNIIFLLLSAFCSFSLHAQMEAYTANGDTVLLFDNGKWDYKNNQVASEETEEKSLPPFNPEKFSKPKSAKEVAKGKNGAYEIWYNASKWDRSVKKNQDGTDMEFNLTNKEGFVLTIFERAEFPLNTLRDVALLNAERVATEFEILKEEMRTVNGREILCLQFAATIQGVKFIYMGYYTSFSEGSLQILAFSYQNLFKEFEPHFEDFLNGLIIKE